MSQAGNSGAKRALILAARSILQPLVRQMIAHGVTFPAFSRLAKEVYIEVGTRHFTLPFKKQTDSRVALVTGITRKEIGQIRRGRTRLFNESAELDYGLATRVIGRWIGEGRYLDPGGHPLELPYETGPETPSFVGLVGDIGGDIPPRAVLDELLRVGAVALSTRGDVRLLQHAYIPARSPEEKIAILGVDAAEFIAAISHNIDHPGEEAFLQRKVYYNNIGGDSLPDLRRKVRHAGAQFVEQINRILAAADRDRNPHAPGGRRMRTVVGVYYLDADYEEDDEAPT